DLPQRLLDELFASAVAAVADDLQRATACDDVDGPEGVERERRLDVRAHGEALVVDDAVSGPSGARGRARDIRGWARADMDLGDVPGRRGDRQCRAVVGHRAEGGVVVAHRLVQGAGRVAV